MLDSLNNIDFLGLWDMFISFMDRLVSWLTFVLGDGKWDPIEPAE